MSTPISRSFLLALLLVGGCRQELADKARKAQAAEQQRKVASAEGRISCALPGSDAFEPQCAIDRTSTQDGLYLTLRHPDGAFHRLLVTKDGRGVVAADGAEQAHVSILGPNQIEVALAGARYRLPATVRLPGK